MGEETAGTRIVNTVSAGEGGGAYPKWKKSLPFGSGAETQKIFRIPPFHSPGGVYQGDLLIAGGLAILGASYLYPYLQGWIDRLYPECLFRRITGLPCLLCGMTRSFAAVSHGRFAEAFRLHPLGPPAFFLLLGGTLALVCQRLRGREFLPRLDERAWSRLRRAGLVLLVAAWVVRLLLFGVDA